MSAGMLAGEVAIVTGGGQGIGLGIGLALARAGATVVLADIDEPRARAAAGLHGDEPEIAAAGGSLHGRRCDVGSRAEIETLVSGGVAEWGRLDILVNNAHDVRTGPVLGISTADLEASWRTGVLGVVRTMQTAHPYLRGGGRVINIVSSVMLKQNTAGFGLYAACKEAIRTITRTAAVEWGRDGIRVNALSPQAASPAWDEWSVTNEAAANRIRSEIPLGRLGDPATDVGPVAVFLASNASRYVTGSLLLADGGRGYLR